MKCKTALLLSFIAILFSLRSFAQTATVTGKVTNKLNGEVLPGATVSVKGGQTVTQTDANGTFSISVPRSGAVLVVTYSGMLDQEIPIAAGVSTYNIQLDSRAGSLNEIIVVGYGTQRKSNITGAISSVKAKDLENVPNGSIFQALEGRVSGVTIMQNSGQPGSGSTIRIRGVTTFKNNDPLWVVDGVVVDQGGIPFLNQSDIESIEVLKDAASSAIYGTRAASGVILVTTKKGKAGKVTVNYNGYYGVSAPAKMLNLLNATQYAVLRNESATAAGKPIVFSDVSSLGIGTDWQKAIFNNDARRWLNEVSMSGGTNVSTYYFSAGIQNNEGIVATDISRYRKINLRLNSTHKLSNMFTFGQTLGYTYQKSTGLGNTNSEFGGPLSSAINLDPITPLVVNDIASQPNATIYNNKYIVLDPNGKPYGISNYVGQEMTNPLAYIQTRLGQYNWSDDIVGNAYLEATPVKGLRIRSTLGVKKAYWGNAGFTPLYLLSSTVSNTTKNNYQKGENRVFNWNVENTITYDKKIGDHNITVLLGQGTYVDNIGGYVGVTLYNLPITSYQDASFNFNIPTTDRDGYTSEGTVHKIYSLFSRVNYSYQDKYLFTGIVRRDGSTKFGTDKKFGLFPSFSAGWNVNKEQFWPSNNVVNNLKIRGGWGVVGTENNLTNFQYISTVVGGYNYPIGSSGAVTTGYAPATLDNKNLHWEETRSADVGFDATILRNLTVGFDWFNKKTNGILRQIIIPAYVGVSQNPFGNVADMTNAGVELELGYHRNFGKLGFSINANGSYVKNTINYVARDTNFITGEASFQSMGTITRTKVGQPYNAFFGYQRLGIFQNQQQIDAYTNKNGALIQPNARPGDFIWADLNGDGQINDLDRTFLGSNLPKYTFGFTINLDYKGFDFMAFGQGVAGNKIFQGLRRLDILTSNYSTKALSRWHGEGTSNDFPRLTDSDPNGNFSKMSDFYLEKGDYLRFKVVQLGYTLPNRLFKRAGISRMRVYVTGENLFTLTNYTGYDPEVGGGVFGVDKGQYPQARTILGGVQLSF